MTKNGKHVHEAFLRKEERLNGTTCRRFALISDTDREMALHNEKGIPLCYSEFVSRHSCPRVPTRGVKRVRFGRHSKNGCTLRVRFSGGTPRVHALAAPKKSGVHARFFHFHITHKSLD
ncbi:hypothetical protein ISCGN_015515 [Ixodes scapularis]